MLFFQNIFFRYFCFEFRRPPRSFFHPPIAAFPCQCPLDKNAGCRKPNIPGNLQSGLFSEKTKGRLLFRQLFCRFLRRNPVFLGHSEGRFVLVRIVKKNASPLAGCFALFRQDPQGVYGPAGLFSEKITAEIHLKIHRESVARKTVSGAGGSAANSCLPFSLHGNFRAEAQRQTDPAGVRRSGTVF